MLTAYQLNVLTDPMAELYAAYEDSIIRDIARRLGKMGGMTETAAWQMQRLIESGKVYENALEEIARLTGMSEITLKQMFQKAGVRAMRFDDSVYRAAGLDPLPLNLSPAMAQVLAAGLQKTGGILRNLTLTTAQAGQDLFVSAADLAYMQVSTGAMSYTQAIREAVKGVAAQGLNVISYAGRRDHLDVAIRRAVLTGINQTAGRLTETRADEMGCDLVQTSAHIGARPEHQVWQGQVFSRSGTSRKYPPFIESTGYGTATGLEGINCRHSHYPFFDGISENVYKKAQLDEYARKTVTYNGKEMPIYDATQKQRAIERKIREWKRQEGALKEAGLDAEFETGKVRDWQTRMRDFTKQTGLSRQREREWVPGGKIVPNNPRSLEPAVKDIRDIITPKNIAREEIVPFGDMLEMAQMRAYGAPKKHINDFVRGLKENGIKYIEAWHISPLDALPKIAENGIKLGGSWYNRNPSVYFIARKSELRNASNFLAMNFSGASGNVGVIRFYIPIDDMGDILEDSMFNLSFDMQSSFRIERNIPADWLDSIEIYQISPPANPGEHPILRLIGR